MEDSAMYALQDIPGKGKGLVATKNIPKGTRILSERPVVTIPEGQQSDKLLKRHISKQVEALDENERRSFLSLHNIYPYKEDVEQFFGIIRTNALPIEENGIGGAILLEACRINHSCHNNARKHWNNRIGRHTVHALREITEGEEITIYYLGLDNIREVRRQKLQNKFGFLCSCSVCSLSTAESEENDQRLQKIQYLDDLVGHECMAMNFSERVLRYVDERIQLDNKQGPDDPGIPRAYLDAAQIAIASGDLARGRVFVERAVEGWRIAQGSDSNEVIEYTPLARNPASLPLYGLSMKWKTSLKDVPSQLHPKDFEHWLWRREQPKKTSQSGQLSSLRNQNIFPGFSDLPNSNRSSSTLFRDFEATYQSTRHWCFLGEISESLTLHNLELELTDINGKMIPLHFNTPGRGSEFAPALIQKGHTVAVLYAERHTFIYGDPGIKLEDPQMLKVFKLIPILSALSGILTYPKIFPMSLKELLELSDQIQQFSGAVNKIRTCHGCNKKVALSNRCGKCSFFWYCDSVRPQYPQNIKQRLTFFPLGLPEDWLV